MGMEGAVGEGQGGGRMMSIEWVEYVGNCGAEGGGLDLAVSSARRLQQSSWMDGDSVVIALFFFARLVACPLGFSGGGLFLGVLGERERTRARVRKCMDRLCILFFVMYFDTPRFGACWLMGRETEELAGGRGPNRMV